MAVAVGRVLMPVLAAVMSSTGFSRDASDNAATSMDICRTTSQYIVTSVNGVIRLERHVGLALALKHIERFGLQAACPASPPSLKLMLF
jgi:hypothetical protein